MPVKDLRNRIWDFDGIANFRDYGDYRTDRGRLPAGLLLRSAQHADATENDLEQLAALPITAIIDLRGSSERLASPCRRHPNFSGTVHYIDTETSNAAPHIEAAKNSDGGSSARDVMRRTDAGMIGSGDFQRVLALYLRQIAEASGKSLVHCAAGKDRTGIAVAILHSILGVHRDDIVADYLLTNKSRHLTSGLPDAMQAVRSRYGAGLRDEALVELLRVRPEYLEAAYAAIEARDCAT